MHKKRVRRTGETVRLLLLDAARALFSERGYGGTATREIAARAGVNEVLLFRHFKSKAQLFEQAVFEPMDRYIREFQESHLAEGVADPGGALESRDFVQGLHELLVRHRHLLMALIAAESYAPEVAAGLKTSNALADYFKVAERYLKRNQPRYAVALPLSVRLSFATTLAAVLFEDWLFAGVSKRNRGELVDQLTRYVLGGIEGGPHGVATREGRSPKPGTARRKSARGSRSARLPA